jgi:tetratricopeptide (TPR) repeat protein
MISPSYKVIPLPPALRRHYLPEHEVTENYLAGTTALENGKLDDALRIFEAEPDSSPCRGLALGSSGLVLNRLEKYGEAEKRFAQTYEHFKAHPCPHPPSWVQFGRNRAESIAEQGRPVEALQAFNSAIHLGKELIARHPDSTNEIELELAHTFNSWGGALIQLQDPKAAADCFRKARDIYRGASSPEKIGHAEVLTNYALALMQIDRRTDASIALQEALPIAEAGGDKDQVRRVQIATIQLDPKLLGIDPYGVLEEAADEAIANGQLSTGYVRLCIKATIAERQNDHAIAISAIEKAKTFESRLDPSESSPADIRFHLARALSNQGSPLNDVLQPLFEGARLFFERLARPQEVGDFQAASQSMHDHFRYFCRKLLDAKRIDEAVTAFEFGRAIAYAVEIDKSRRDVLIRQNPFISESDLVDPTFLREQQSRLKEDEVILIPAILPPEIITFIIRRNAVEVVSVNLPRTGNECQALLSDLHAMPIRLSERVGLRAVPAKIQELASAIADRLAASKVCAVLPHAILHLVPWRAVLRHSGMSLNQLNIVTGFGLVARKSSKTAAVKDCSALGYGSTESIDLNQEAEDFAMAFGAGGQFIRDCEPKDIANALIQRSAVMISCHGQVRTDQDDGPRILTFLLKGGSATISEILPANVSSELVILSACNSGAYEVAWGDYPIGAGPEVLRRGARLCVTARFPVHAAFAAKFMVEFGKQLACGTDVVSSFVLALHCMEGDGADPWKDLACFELLGDE